MKLCTGLTLGDANTWAKVKVACSTTTTTSGTTIWRRRRRRRWRWWRWWWRRRGRGNRIRSRRSGRLTSRRSSPNRERVSRPIRQTRDRNRGRTRSRYVPRRRNSGVGRRSLARVSRSSKSNRCLCVAARSRNRSWGGRCPTVSRKHGSFEQKHYALKSPNNTHEFSAVFKSVEPDHCARSFNPGVEFTVTPPAPATVT